MVFGPSPLSHSDARRGYFHRALSPGYISPLPRQRRSARLGL